MTKHRFDPLTQSLHWLVALLVITSYAIGVVREDLPKGDFRSWLLTVHMSLGMIVFALSIVRLMWRSITPAPTPIAGQSSSTRLAAKAGHALLYVAMFAVPVVGLLAAWIKGRTVGFFNLAILPTPFPVDKALGSQIEHLHTFAGHAMMLLAGGHALAAIAHQFWLKDGTLGRMLPVLSPRPAMPMTAVPVGE